MRNLLLALLFLAACRQIVGVEDVELEADGDDDTVEAGASSSSSGTIGDASGDASPATGDAAACIDQANCRRCCKQEFPKLASFQAAQKLCLCELCPTECAESQWYCLGGNGEQGSPDAPCQKCIDDKIAENQCSVGCDADCQAGRACLQACPAPPQ